MVRAFRPIGAFDAIRAFEAIRAFQGKTFVDGDASVIRPPGKGSGMQRLRELGKDGAHEGGEAVTGVSDDGVSPEEGTIAALVADNDLQLAELAQFLLAVGPAVYAQPNGEDAAIGQHVRHVLDHYECLLGATDGRVDYTRRAREEIVGCCLETAISRIDATRHRLAELSDIQGASPESSGAGLHTGVIFTPARSDCQPVQRCLTSTLERELMFVLSHTIHHMALIAVLVRRQSAMPIPTGFGVAPSTMRYAGQG